MGDSLRAEHIKDLNAKVADLNEMLAYVADKGLVVELSVNNNPTHAEGPQPTANLVAIIHEVD